MKVFLTLISLGILGALAALGFVYSGFYDISATDQHLRPTYYAIKKAMERSVERRAKDIEPPPLGAPAQLERGLGLFRAHCVQCHGAPGVAPEPFALGLTPLATPLQRSGLERTPAQIYWMVRYGIKMTGMPAWEFRMTEEDLWAVVAFVKHLPSLSPLEYAKLQAPAPGRIEETLSEKPDRGRGRKALKLYGCIACHEIPGEVGPEARLGPTLHGMGARETIGGVLPNTPENMARWLRDPKAFSPHTAMPNLGVIERDARDMAAYLATLR